MNVSWSDLFTALALLLILEGLFPFISPDGMKKTLAQLINYPDQSMRMIGLACIVAGVLLLLVAQ